MFGGIFSTLSVATRQLGVGMATRAVFGGPQTQALRSMSKLKTHKGASKRWKALANGLYKRRQTGLRHLNRKLPSKIRRSKHAPVLCTKGQQRHLDRLLPY
ncbi:hypothetical protein H4R24_002674 [Coemansia sp. RSA 988]|nr:hypothetical protein H4R24_002674 [Coemansia sp. RSA 988]